MQEGKDYFIVDKSESRFMRFLSKLLFFNKDFMTGYITTIGRTIYCPGGEINPTVLAHELQHVQDYNKWRILFMLSYLLLLPFGWTFRAHWERKAYRITIKLDYQDSPAWVKSAEYRAWLKRIFTGPDYFWMELSGKRFDRWFDSVIAECESSK